MFSILNRALSWAITSFGNKFCLKSRSRLIKALNNRFCVKFMQLEIGLLGDHDAPFCEQQYMHESCHISLFKFKSFDQFNTPKTASNFRPPLSCGTIASLEPANFEISELYHRDVQSLTVPLPSRLVPTPFNRGVECPPPPHLSQKPLLP